MLGSNDFQCTHDNNAWLSAQGIGKLINIIRQAPIEPCMPIPDIMVIAPPKIIIPKGVIANKFCGAEKRCVGLAKELALISSELSTYFFNASDVTGVSTVDGIHLDENQHAILLGVVAATIGGSFKMDDSLTLLLFLFFIVAVLGFVVASLYKQSIRSSDGDNT